MPGRCSQTPWWCSRSWRRGWRTGARICSRRCKPAHKLHEVHPAPSAEEDAAADAAAAAVEGAVPFVPGRYGAADHSMEEAVKLSHGNGR